MMKEELKELKEKFIVNQDKYDEKQLPDVLQVLLKYVRVGTEGKVYLQSQDIQPDNKLKIVLAARFIASQLQENVSSSTTVGELSEATHLSKDQVRARMSVMVKNKFADRDERGVFSVLPFRINSLIDELRSFGGKQNEKR